ncbi:MAG: hypothetical protein EGR80_11790 [Ruminiclostridium sp.]|nr:hypothetical protein [Ruminiclostridium sp.]
MSKAKRKNSSYKTEPKKPVINSRSDRIRYANQKLYDCPLSVTWFRIFKTVITVLQAVMSGYSAIVCVVSVFASFSDDVQEKANAAAISGFIAYNIVMSVLLAAVVPLCVIMFRQLSELTQKSYGFLKFFLIYSSAVNAVSTSASELFRFVLFKNTEGFNVSITNILFAIFSVVFMAVWLILNLRYFKNRRSLFSD